ncbi:MAG: SDR family oxidoreductase [Acidimicrobiales bacterium]
MGPGQPLPAGRTGPGLPAGQGHRSRGRRLSRPAPGGPAPGGPAPGGPCRVGLTGASGYLGQRLARAAVGAGHEVVDLGRDAGVDLLEPATLVAAVRASGPDVVVHAAAANPGRPPDTFDVVNRAASAALAETCAALGLRLVHVSTDTVFDGRSAPYADGAPACPINAYGASKAEAEAAVLGACPGALVVRTSLIYGLHEPDRGTAGFLAALQAGQRVSLFSDVIRQPVWVEALAAGLLQLATELPDEAGIMNLAGSQALDRAAFARRMLRFWEVDPSRWGGGLDDVQAADGVPGVPLDLRLTLQRAVTLGLSCPGVDEVLASFNVGGADRAGGNGCAR